MEYLWGCGARVGRMVDLGSLLAELASRHESWHSEDDREDDSQTRLVLAVEQTARGQKVGGRGEAVTGDP